jgi:hypothetical protein
VNRRDFLGLLAGVVAVAALPLRPQSDAHLVTHDEFSAVYGGVPFRLEPIKTGDRLYLWSGRGDQFATVTNVKNGRVVVDCLPSSASVGDIFYKARR